MTMINVGKQVFMKHPEVIKDTNLSAGVAKAFSSLRVKREADRITVNMQIPSVAWAALVEKMQNTSPKKFNAMEDFIPGKKK